MCIRDSAILVILGVFMEAVPAEKPLVEVVPLIPFYFLFGCVFWILFNRLNKYLVFVLAPVSGVIMEFGFMRPDEILSEGTLHATIFFAAAWSFVLLLPYVVTKLLMRKKLI